MQLSADPADFSWGRWYWTRPGALPLTPVEAYGAPKWQTDEGDVPAGPRFWLEVNDQGDAGRMAGVVRVPRPVTVYAGSRVGPFAGLHYHGEPSWFRDGLPPGVGRDWRPGWDGGPVGAACGAEHWQTDGGPVPAADMGQAGGALFLAGGAMGGGNLGFAVACRIFYGGCLHLVGGGEGGGVMPTTRGASLPLSGGGEGGGELPTATGAALPLDGGGEGGGALEFLASGGLPLSGGGEGGGEMSMGGGGGDTEMPVGAIISWAGSGAIPANCLECDGATYLEVSYPDLFAVVGHDWDAWRGQSAPGAGLFRVPLLAGVVLGGVGGALGAADGIGATSARAFRDGDGAEAVSLSSGELASHTHTLTDPGHTHTLTDPGHLHTTFDPGHQHGVSSGAGSNLVDNAAAIVAAADFLPASTGTASTGVTVQSAATGASVATNTTGATVDAAGSGSAHDNVQPTVFVKYLIVATL